MILKDKCEKCHQNLDLQSDCRICSYECTFCENCSQEMNNTCPNCHGELLTRPKRDVFSNNYHIFHDFIINENTEKIFEAFSTPSGLNNWWTLKCNGDFIEGNCINLYFGELYNWYVDIVKFEENKLIEFKTKTAKDEWLPTSFGFKLNEINKLKTEVSFYHINWSHPSKEFKIANFCWGQLLAQLKNYIENGIITPFEQRN